MQTIQQARQILDESDVLFSETQVQQAIDKVAGQINTRLHDRLPLILTVMTGAVYFAGQLLPRLTIPLECDAIHLSRYNNELSGGQIKWRVGPRHKVAGRTVLVLDDILDEGLTLKAVCERLASEGAADVQLAVLCEKALGITRPVSVDFLGFTVPNRYVFGCGMDVHGLWRNLPRIHALR